MWLPRLLEGLGVGVGAIRREPGASHTSGKTSSLPGFRVPSDEGGAGLSSLGTSQKIFLSSPTLQH